MPLLDVCLEVDACEQAAAKADENAHHCDLCRKQLGERWLAHLWLCELCRYLTLLRLAAEPNS